MVIKSRCFGFIFDSPWGDLPKTPAIISAQEPDKYFLSISDYRLFAKRLASGLRRAGLQPGDRVLLFSGNTLFYPSFVIGVIMAEGIFTGANPLYVARELTHQWKDSGAKFLVCAEASLNTAIIAAKELGKSADSIFIFDDGIPTFEKRNEPRSTTLGTIRPWTYLLDSEEQGHRYAWPELRTSEELDRVVALNYSSGTTGVAKGVMISHRNYVANCSQQIHMQQQAPHFQEKLRNKRLLCFLPMYHAMGQTNFCVNTMKQRIPVYMMPRFDLYKMLQYVEKYRITDLYLVPPVVVAMAKNSATRKFDLSSVESVFSGAAPLGREICEELERIWPKGQVNVRQGWGMTEATCAATTFSPAKYSASFSVGEVVANSEIKIVLDDEGKVEAKQGERGEIWYRGPNVMRGYWNKPEATKETVTNDGWLKSGDVAYVDEENQFFIVDRKKELIKVKGLQVAPAELEALLLNHPDVQDAAVISVTSNDEELPRAYVVPQTPEKGTAETGEDIKKWLAERVSKHKRLEGGARFGFGFG